MLIFSVPSQIRHLEVGGLSQPYGCGTICLFWRTFVRRCGCAMSGCRISSSRPVGRGPAQTLVDKSQCQCEPSTQLFASARAVQCQLRITGYSNSYPEGLNRIEMAANQKIVFALVCLFLACDLALGQQQPANSSDAESDVAG